MTPTYAQLLAALGKALAMINCGPKHVNYSQKEIAELMAVFKEASK